MNYLHTIDLCGHSIHLSSMKFKQNNNNNNLCLIHVHNILLKNKNKSTTIHFPARNLQNYEHYIINYVRIALIILC